jgi:hypothetical protein
MRGVIFSLQAPARSKAPVLITITNFTKDSQMKLDRSTGLRNFRLELPPTCVFPLSLAYTYSTDRTQRNLTLFTAPTDFIHRLDGPSVDSSASMNVVEFFFRCVDREAASCRLVTLFDPFGLGSRGGIPMEYIKDVDVWFCSVLYDPSFPAPILYNFTLGCPGGDKTIIAIGGRRKRQLVIDSPLPNRVIQIYLESWTSAPVPFYWPPVEPCRPPSGRCL